MKCFFENLKFVNWSVTHCSFYQPLLMPVFETRPLKVEIIFKKVYKNMRSLILGAGAKYKFLWFESRHSNKSLHLQYEQVCIFICNNPGKKNLATPSKFLTPLTMLIIRWFFFPFCWKKKPQHFSPLLRGDERYVIQLKCLD